jgi:hypothetical protein
MSLAKCYSSFNYADVITAVYNTYVIVTIAKGLIKLFTKQRLITIEVVNIGQ